MPNDPKPFLKPVHVRRTQIRTFDLGGHRVLVEGTLQDTRMPSPSEKTPADPSELVHDLVARIEVQGPDLTILSVGAEMPHIPREMCREVLPDMQRLVGVKIVRGYTQEVKDRIGDVKGCSHLTHLFISLGPAAVQGYWAAYGRKPEVRSLRNPAVRRVLDSCRVWRRDGPLARSLTPDVSKTSKET